MKRFWERLYVFIGVILFSAKETEALIQAITTEHQERPDIFVSTAAIKQLARFAEPQAIGGWTPVFQATAIFDQADHALDPVLVVWIDDRPSTIFFTLEELNC